MDAIFGFLGKLIGTTAKIGAGVMVAALMLLALVESQIPPFASLSSTSLYQAIIVGGLLGFGTLMVQIIIASWRLFRQWRAEKIIFIHRNTGIWNYVESDGVFQLRAVFLATNNNDLDIVPADARVCLQKFMGKRVWRQCFQVHVSGELWIPAHPELSVPPPLGAHSVTALALNDIHLASMPPSRSPVFLFELRDQWDRPHRVRLRLEPAPPIKAASAPARPGVAAGALLIH